MHIVKPINWMNPACLVIGSFCPLTSSHKKLLEGLAAYSAECDLTAVVAVLTPHPGIYVQGPEKWAVAQNLEALVDDINRTVECSVVPIRMAPPDLDKGFEDLLTLLQGCGPIAELWLGNQQSLGSGSKGNRQAILHHASLHGIRVLDLLPMRSSRTTRVRQSLLEGQVETAGQALGYRPRFRRPDFERTVFTGWKPATYQASATTSDGKEHVIQVEMVIMPERGTHFIWPCDDYHEISF